jgi:hypothetical protein
MYRPATAVPYSFYTFAANIQWIAQILKTANRKPATDNRQLGGPKGRP